MNKLPTRTKITEGSGNIFEDLGFENPQDEQSKAQIILTLGRIIKERKLTQTAAAALIGLSQPRLSQLLNGNWEGYTLDRLFRYLNALGSDVQIHIAPCVPRGEGERAKTTVAA